MAEDDQIYHERQRKQLCALHVLNNLLQEKDAFTEAQLDQICTELTPSKFMNPHRSMLGLGNYDVNVLTAALQTRNLNLVWFDRRKDVSGIDLTQVKGVIINIPSDYNIGFVKMPFDFKHWYLIRDINGTFYNLDSKLDRPAELGDTSAVHRYIKEQLEKESTHVLLVMQPEVEQSGAWFRKGDNNLQNEVLDPQ